MPDQFGNLQSFEFEDLLEGYHWREDHKNMMQAYWTSCIMSVHTKRPVKPTDLWKTKTKKKNKKDDEKHLREVFKLQGGEK